MQAALSAMGYTLVRTEWMKRLLDPAGARRAALLKYHEIQTVIDVGANMGQYGGELRAWDFKGRIISFEPTSVAFNALSERTAGDANWQIFNFALGAEAGVAELNVASNSGQSSSFMPMLDAHRQGAPEVKYLATEQVSVKTLDSALSDCVTPRENLSLKLDVQGFEHLVLRGATSTLPQVRLIECELSLVQLYDGQMLISQMLSLLDSLDFVPICFTPAFSNPVSGHCLQIDGIFAHRD